MNRVIIWDKKNNFNNNYMIISFLIMFNIFKIFGCIYYDDILSIYKMGVYYFAYSFLEYFFSKLFNKKRIDNYFLVNALIISYIVPGNVSIYIFLLGSILGILIRYLSKDRLSSSIILTLFCYIYLYYMDNINVFLYTGILKRIYLGLCFISFLLLAGKKLIKRYIPLILIFLYLIINKGRLDNELFIIIFMASDTRYNSLTKRGEIISVIILATTYYLFKIVLNVNYGLLLSIFISEIGAIMINKKRL